MVRITDRFVGSISEVRIVLVLIVIEFRIRVVLHGKCILNALHFCKFKSISYAMHVQWRTKCYIKHHKL